MAGFGADGRVQLSVSCGRATKLKRWTRTRPGRSRSGGAIFHSSFLAAAERALAGDSLTAIADLGVQGREAHRVQIRHRAKVPDLIVAYVARPTGRRSGAAAARAVGPRRKARASRSGHCEKRKGSLEADTRSSKDGRRGHDATAARMRARESGAAAEDLAEPRTLIC